MSQKSMRDYRFPSFILCVVVLIVWFIIVQLRTSSRYRKNISNLFDGTESDGSTRKVIEEALQVINSESTRFMFTMERLTRISLRGKKIILVLGRAEYLGAYVGSRDSRLSSRNDRCVFTLADSAESEWMRASHDVFKPAFAGSSHSVFWVQILQLGDVVI